LNIRIIKCNQVSRSIQGLFKVNNQDSSNLRKGHIRRLLKDSRKLTVNLLRAHTKVRNQLMDSQYKARINLPVMASSLSKAGISRKLRERILRKGNLYRALIRHLHISGLLKVNNQHTKVILSNLNTCSHKVINSQSKANIKLQERCTNLWGNHFSNSNSLSNSNNKLIHLINSLWEVRLLQLRLAISSRWRVRLLQLRLAINSRWRVRVLQLRLAINSR
jgi:hypothetical protein